MIMVLLTRGIFLALFVFTMVLSILIVVHEWGHFITAKKMGVDVEKFSLGFIDAQERIKKNNIRNE